MSTDVRNDKYWVDAGSFASGLGVPARQMIAPVEFGPLLDGSVPYGRRDELPAPDVVVVHKGRLAELGRVWIEDQLAVLNPAFANEVFVILTRRKTMGPPTDSPHFKSFLGMLKALVGKPTAPPRPFFVYLGDHKALTRTIYGHKMFVDTRDDRFTPHVALDGVWEPWVAVAFRKLIEPGMTVVDIGADNGYYALIAADLVGREGKLVAFEPNPNRAAMMQSSLSVNGMLDRSKIERMDMSGGGMAQWDHSSDASRLAASDEAATVSLDGYFTPGERIDVVKIGTEEAGPAILKGAVRVIDENKDIRIVTKVSSSLFGSTDGNPAELHDVISAMGLKMHRINHDGTLIEKHAVDLANIEGRWDVVLKRQ